MERRGPGEARPLTCHGGAPLSWRRDWHKARPDAAGTARQLATADSSPPPPSPERLGLLGRRHRPARRREVADKKIDRSSTSAGGRPEPVPGGPSHRLPLAEGPSRAKIPPNLQLPRYNRPKFAILKREQWDIYFWTLWRSGTTSVTVNGRGAKHEITQTLHRCK